MQRNDWKFTYTAAKLAEVADDKLRALSSAEHWSRCGSSWSRHRFFAVLQTACSRSQRRRCAEVFAQSS